MAMRTFKVIGFDQGEVHESKGNLRFVCMVEGGGKLAVWGNAISRKNIDTIIRATLPCTVVCDCIPPKEWAIQCGHTFWVPEGNLLRIPSH
jgi:hypothetical protein